MTMQFLPSKWGHILDDAEITLMLEPIPGTQVIYEFLNDCSRRSLKKVYPPNSTVRVYNACPLELTVLGEVAKLVVDYNAFNGVIWLGDLDKLNSVATQEVVIRSNYGYISLYNKMKSIEVQENAMFLSVDGDVTEHIDLRKNTITSTYSIVSETCPDLWIGNQCGLIQFFNTNCPQGRINYFNDDC